MSDFPFAAVLGMEHAKLALLLLAVDPGLKGVLIAGPRGTGKSLLARSIFRDGPFVEVPVGVTEDRLLGSLDVELTLKSARRQLLTGIIAQADGGFLYVDEANLIEPRFAWHIAGALNSGGLRVERDGLSKIVRSEFAAIATYDPLEGEVDARLSDAFGLHVDRVGSLTLPERVEMLSRVARHQHSVSSLAGEFEAATALLKERITKARCLLPHVTMRPEEYRELSRTALSLGVEGHRADLFAVRLARAHAAFEQRTQVAEPDLLAAVEFVLGPRSRTTQAGGAPETAEFPHNGQNGETAGNTPSESAEDLVLPAEQASVPDRLLNATSSSNPLHAVHCTKSNSHSVSYSRGRYVRPAMRKSGKIALDATLRTAVLSQTRRREQRASATVRVTASDLRYKQFKLDPGLLVIFAVDASGSMAVNRIGQAKGAVIRLLQESYQHRFSVAVVSFRGDKARILLQPTRSVMVARRVLDEAAVGGGTPLASGIATCLDLARRAKATGGPPALLVLLTDGCANVPLSREAVWQELETVCGTVRSERLPSVVIDTSNRMISSGAAERVASLLGGRYVYLPRAGTDAVYQAVSSAAGLART